MTFRWTIREQLRGRLTAAALALTLVTAAPGSAIVRVEEGTPEPGWSGSVGLDVAIESGNTDETQLSTALTVRNAELWPAEELVRAGIEPADLKLSRRVLLLALSYAYGESREASFKNRGFAHLRWTKGWRPRWSYELFTQVEYDRFRDLESRLLGGAGLRWGAVIGQTGRVFLGSGYMIEREVNDVEGTGSGDDAAVAHRSTSYLSVLLQHGDRRVVFASTTYVQPRLDDLQDVRLLHQSTVEFAVLKSLTLGVSFNVAFDGEPPPGVEKTDLSLKNSLRLRF